MRKLFESLFGEGIPVGKLDAKQLDQLKKETSEFAHDWPSSTFSIEFYLDEKDKLKINKFCIPQVDSYLSTIADGLGWDMGDLSAAEIQKVFMFLSGFKDGIQADMQEGPDGGIWVSYDFQIKNWHYNAVQNRIDIDATISNVKVTEE